MHAAEGPLTRRRGPLVTLELEKLFMNSGARSIRTLIVVGLCFSLLMGVLVNANMPSRGEIRGARLAGNASALADPDPSANAGPNQTVVVGERVHFDASLSTAVGTANYTWSFIYDGAGAKLYGVRPNFTFQRIGDYNITLNLTDGSGHNDTDQVLVKVIAKRADATSLLYSGGAAAVVAALLVFAFFAMRSSRKGENGETSDESSEEEFEEV